MVQKCKTKKVNQPRRKSWASRRRTRSQLQKTQHSRVSQKGKSLFLTLPLKVLIHVRVEDEKEISKYQPVRQRNPGAYSVEWKTAAKHIKNHEKEKNINTRREFLDPEIQPRAFQQVRGGFHWKTNLRALRFAPRICKLWPPGWIVVFKSKRKAEPPHVQPYSLL